MGNPETKVYHLPDWSILLVRGSDSGRRPGSTRPVHRGPKANCRTCAKLASYAEARERRVIRKARALEKRRKARALEKRRKARQ